MWTLPTGILAQAEFNYGNVEMGTRLIGNIARTIEHGMLGAFSELIPQGGDFMQLWSAAMFLNGITEGIFGLESLAHQHRLVLSPQLPNGWKFARLEGVKVGLHTIDIALDREEEGGYRVLIGQQGEMELDIELFLPSVGEPAWLTEEVAYTQEPVGDLTKFSFVLEPEQRVQVTIGETR